jgi:3',5'-cyclic-AMP phosphodiesterase
LKGGVRMSKTIDPGPISRRHFFNISLAAAGGVVALTPRWSAAQEEKKQEVKPEASRSEGQPARWVFLSDTHIAADPQNNYRGSYPYQNLEKTLAQIAADLPEGIVVTGDLARLTGQPGDYENFKKLLTPAIGQRPVYLALGNHDHRGNFLKAFENPAGQKQALKNKHVLTVDAGLVRFILLDSLFLTNETSGLLGKVQRTWLQHYLQTSDDKPVILFFHHSLRDDDGDLLDSPRLFDLIKPLPKVKALIYGHSHEYAFSDYAGIHLINLPAVGYNFADQEPLGWVEVRLTATGGAFVLHAVAGNRALDGESKQLRWRS